MTASLARVMTKPSRKGVRSWNISSAIDQMVPSARAMFSSVTLRLLSSIGMRRSSRTSTPSIPSSGSTGKSYGVSSTERS